MYFTGKQETFINFITPFNELNLNPNISMGIFMSKCWGYPVPKLDWFDIYGNKIGNDFNIIHRFQTYWNSDENLSILKIENLDYNVCGEYVLRARNTNLEKNETFQLFIHGIIGKKYLKKRYLFMKCLSIEQINRRLRWRISIMAEL